MTLLRIDLRASKIHASALQNSLAAEEAAGGPRARARCVILVSMHDMTLSHRPATLYRCAAAVSVDDLRAGARVYGVVMMAACA